jgi:hypothetical protein
MRHNHPSQPTGFEAAFGRMMNLWPGITPPTKFQDILWDAVAACLILCVSIVSIISGTVLDQWLNLGLLEMRVDIWSLPIAIGIFIISLSAMLALVQMLIVGIPASFIRGLRLLAKSLRGGAR